MAFKPRFVFLVLAILLLCLMCQEIAALRRLSSKEVAGNYDAKIPEGLKKKKQEVMREADYGGGSDEAPPHEDYDYDFYRKHGDVPSPGAGH